MNAEFSDSHFSLLQQGATLTPANDYNTKTRLARTFFNTLQKLKWEFVPIIIPIILKSDQIIKSYHQIIIYILQPNQDFPPHAINRLLLLIATLGAL